MTDEAREQFEKWHLEKYGFDPAQSWWEAKNRYFYGTVYERFVAWQAGRQSGLEAAARAIRQEALLNAIFGENINPELIGKLAAAICAPETFIEVPRFATGLSKYIIAQF